MKWTEVVESGFPETLIAEFLKVFGTEKTKQLIDIFGGVSFDVPSWTDIHRKQALLEKQEEGEPNEG